MVGDDPDTGRVLLQPVAEALVGEIQQGQNAALGTDCSYRLPLFRREIGAGGIVTAAVQQQHIPGGDGLQRGHHGVKGHTVAFGLKVGIGLYLQSRRTEYIWMIRPGWVTQPDRSLGRYSPYKVGGYSQCAGAAGCLHGGRPPVGKNWVLAAKDYLLAQGPVCRKSIYRQIALCRL